VSLKSAIGRNVCQSLGWRAAWAGLGPLHSAWPAPTQCRYSSLQTPLLAWTGIILHSIPHFPSGSRWCYL